MNQDCAHIAAENEQLLLMLHQAQEELGHRLHEEAAYQARIRDLTRQLEAARLAARHRINALEKFTDWLGLTHYRQLHAICTCPLFDADWYKQQYPDVAERGVEPAKHFLEHGAREGRNPGPGFDTRWYVSTYPDVAKSGMNPLLHYLWHGRTEGRLPCPGGEGQTDPYVLERRWLQQARDEQARLAQERQQALMVLEQERAALEQDKAALAVQFEQARQEVQTLGQARAALERRSAELEERLAETEERLNLSRSELEAVRAEHAEQIKQQEVERSALAQRLDGVEGELVAVQQARDEQARLAQERQQALMVLEQERAALEQDKAALAVQFEQARQEVQTLGQARAALERRSAELEELLAEARARVDALAGELTEVRTRLGQREAQLSRYRQETEQEQRRIDEGFRLIKEMLLKEAG